MSAARSKSSCTATRVLLAGSVAEKLAEQEHAEDGERDRDEEVRAPDRRQERPQRLRLTLPDLAGEPGAEHEVVQVRARRRGARRARP